MIEIKNLKKTYEGEKHPTLDIEHLSFPDTGLYFLLGKSGAGKTTLACLIGGMDNDYQGEIKVFGKVLKNLSLNQLSDYRALHIGFAFQGEYLDYQNTVEKEILKPFDIVYRAKKSAYLKDLLDALEMTPLRKRKINTLSGGERKRVALLKALIKKPSIVILDEPTAGLNENLAKKVLLLLKEIAKETLLLVITHDLSLTEGENSIRLENGRVVEECIRAKVETKRRFQNRLKKNNFIHRFWCILLSSFSSFLQNLKKVGPASFAMATAITIAGFSSLLVIGINDGFSQMASSSLDARSVVVKPKEAADSLFYQKMLSGEEMYSIKEQNEGSVLSYGIKYLKDVNNIFTPDSGFYINIGEWKYPKNFGLNILANPTLVQDYGLLNFYPTIQKESLLSDKEVYLGLTSGEFDAVMRKANAESDVAKLEKLIANNGVKLVLSAQIKEIPAVKERTLQVKSIYRSNTVEIRHTNPFFAQELFETNLGCQSSYELDALDPLPYTIKKAGVVYIKKNNIGTFFRNVSFSDYFKDKRIYRLPYDAKANTIPFAFTYKKAHPVRTKDIKDIYFNKAYNVASYSISSSVYEYLASGLYEGFTLPLFVSPDKAGLNELMDNHSVTEMNLQGYAFASDSLPENVLGSSLTDSILKRGVQFRSPVNEKILVGKFPDTDREIAISKGLAKKFFGGSYKAHGKNLNLLMLDTVEIKDGLYNNKFAEASLRISAILDEEDLALYHDPLFPLVFAFVYTSFPVESLNVESFILRFDTDEQRDDAVEKLRKDYPSYYFSMPLKEMSEELNGTLKKVGLGLSFFAGVSIVLACLLLFLTIYLEIKKDEQRIGELLSIGYCHSEVNLFYVFYALFIGIASSIQSIFGLYFAKRIAVEQLSESFNGYNVEIGAFPYLLALGISLVFSLLVGLCVSSQTKHYSPTKAFKL